MIRYRILRLLQTFAGLPLPIFFCTKLKVIIYSNITQKNENKILKRARVIGKKRPKTCVHKTLL